MNLTIFFKETYLQGGASVSGPREKESEVSSCFDYSFDDICADEKSGELGEIKMVKKAISILLNKRKDLRNEIDLCLGGDLLNQCAVSNHIGCFLPVSFFSVYGACSSLILGMIISSYFVSNNTCRNVINFASSNYISAERQFRYPTKYGCQKKETSTITSTGASAVLIGKRKTKIKIVSATIGKVEDVKWDNVNDLGSPMSYAAYMSINAHLKNVNKRLEDYDLILTGDLSKIGSKILYDIFLENGIEFKNHIDAGSLLYSFSNEYFSGGSGCACIGLVTFSYITNKLLNNEIQNVLLVGTGALHSPTLINQKESIPVVAHVIELERVK